MLYQYVPPPSIQAVFVGVALVYAANHKSPFVAPCAVVLASAAVAYLDFALPGIMTTDQLAFSLQTASVVMSSVLATGGKIKGM